MGDGEASRFAAEWRQSVMQQFREQSEVNQQLSKSLADLASTVNALKASVDDMKRGPKEFSSMFSSYGGCLASVVFVSFSLINFLLAVSSLIYTIVK